MTALLPERTRSEVLGVKTSTYLFEGDAIQSVTPDHTSKRTKVPQGSFQKRRAVRKETTALVSPPSP